MSSDHKYKRLDSIRGLAALSVGVGHAALFAQFPKQSWWRFGLLGVFNGHYAVDVFFVLSGFVLTNMVREFSGPAYAGYLARRLLRLYPPLWATLIVAYAAQALVTARGWSCGSTLHWGCHFISKGPPRFYGIIKSAFPVDYSLDPVLWSIRVELEASLVYPLVLLLWRRCTNGWRVAIIAGAVLMTCVSVGSSPQPRYMFFLVGLPHYLLLFIIGIVISDYRISRASHGNVALTVGICIMLVSGFAFRGHSGLDDLIATASAAMLISVATYACPSWLGAVLDNRAILGLGELSYSYYLLNGIVLWVIARMIVGSITVAPAGDLRALVLFSAFAFPAALMSALLSYGMNRAIEKPSIRCGRSVEKYILWVLNREPRTPRPVGSDI